MKEIRNTKRRSKSSGVLDSDESTILSICCILLLALRADLVWRQNLVNGFGHLIYIYGFPPPGVKSNTPANSYSVVFRLSER